MAVEANNENGKMDMARVATPLKPTIMFLEDMHKAAEEFVRVHYAVKDTADRNIKILATMNQIIELRKGLGQKG